jgi:hypothetical protein
MWALGDSLRELVPIGILPLVVLLTGVPHYGATVLRVCEREEDRRAYSRVSIAASLALVALLALGLRSELLGSLVLTLYLTWSPWHYSGQNYGIALMFLRRREIEITPAAKRWIYAFFVLSFALVALSIHAEVPGADYAPIQYQDASYRRMPIGIPLAVHDPAMVAIAVACGLSLVAAATLLVRAGAGPRDLAAPALIALSQALWFTVPALSRFAGWFQDGGPLSADYAVYAFVWVGVAHSVQYLWVTSYYAARSTRAEGRPTGSAFLAGYGARVLAIGAALWILPALVFAPGALGEVPFHGGLAALVAAVVNLHHFVLDGVIWKLRDGRIARILIPRADPVAPRAAASSAVAPLAGPAPRPPRAQRGGAWAIGVAGGAR